MKKLIFIYFLLLFTCKSALASQAIGSEITFDYYGNNLYRVYFTFYGECSGSSINMSNLTVVQDSDTSYINMAPLNPPPVLIGTGCSSTQSTCNGGSSIGIEKYVFYGYLLLEDSTSECLIYHSEYSRFNNYSTLISLYAELFVSARIIHSPGMVNSSPVFRADPVPFICKDQFFCLYNEAFDPDGDSLSYKLIGPRTGPNAADTLTFINGYSSVQPMMSNPPMTFNSSDGRMCFTPTQSENTPYAIQISEYRNGMLIGQVERDMALIIEPCPNTNNIPACGGINDSLPTNNLTVCAAQLTCFFLVSKDLDASDTTYLSWDNSIPGMTATNSSGQRDTLFFCWTPSDADTLHPVHNFLVKVSDNACPISGNKFINYSITVQPSYYCSPLEIKKVDAKEIKLNVFPQPASEYLKIELGNINNSIVDFHLKIYSLIGNVVYESTFNGFSHVIKVNPDIQDGIYLCSITSDDKTICLTRKIIVQK